MPYQEETIKTILDRLNTQYFLPSIQRNYVWKPPKVILLFDSIMRGYPISSFLFWELTKENRDRWEVYKFCEEAISTGTQHSKHPSQMGIQNLTLVLDGQQRLTSLLIGLKGVFRIRRNRQHYIPLNYPVCRLYLNMFKDPSPIDDENEFTGKPYYSFEWRADPPENTNEEWWFQVGRILDCQDDNKFYDLREAEEKSFPKNITKPQENLFERNLWRLYQAIWKDAAISYYVERDQDYDRVLDIFVRANEAGVALSKPEIIVSMLESKWKKGAKDKLDKLMDQVNKRLSKPNAINIEFIMRSCLVMSNLPVRYRINTFTSKNIELVEGLWPKIHNAIVRAFKLVNRFGIDSSNLSSLNNMIPLVLYLYLNPKNAFLGTTQFEVKNAGLMRRWLILAMLNRVGARGADQVIANLRHAIQSSKPGEDFPVKALNAELERMRFGTEFDDKAIRTYLDSQYPVEFLKLSLLYDDHFWDAVTTQQDHIFPQSLFTNANKEFAALPPKKKERYLELCNRVANLELLIDRENNEKRAKPFKLWLETRDKDFRKRHLIPSDDALLSFDRFEEFISEREKLINNKLMDVI